MLEAAIKKAMANIVNSPNASNLILTTIEGNKERLLMIETINNEYVFSFKDERLVFVQIDITLFVEKMFGSLGKQIIQKITKEQLDVYLSKIKSFEITDVLISVKKGTTKISWFTANDENVTLQREQICDILAKFMKENSEMLN